VRHDEVSSPERVADPRILRLIQKWLNAGVIEDGQWSDTKTGRRSTFTTGIRRDCRSLRGGCLSERWKIKSIAFCRELRANSATRTAVCTSRTIGLLARRHIVAGEFHYIGKEASTRWGGGVDLSMLAEAGALDPADLTFREYERVVDPNYLDEIRAQAKQFSTKRLSRQARLAEDTIRKFKNGRNTIRPRSLRKLTWAIHDLQNENVKN
jgi:hypothetical protein